MSIPQFATNILPSTFRYLQLDDYLIKPVKLPDLQTLLTNTIPTFPFQSV